MIMVQVKTGSQVSLIQSCRMVGYAFVVLAILSMPSISNAQTSVTPVGTGTTIDPYLIASIDNLYWLSQTPSAWGTNFRQTADIDAAATKTWHSGLGFSPIGNGTTKFTGTYNGNGKIISNLYVIRTTTNNIGLFGYDSAATIENLGIVNDSIVGKNFVGGLIGNAFLTTIRRCFITGNISGSAAATNTGGIVGAGARNNISNCYSTCAIVASGLTAIAGGFMGSGNSDTVANCYSTGMITGSASTVGGFIGSASLDSLSSCFWDITTSGKSTSAGGTGVTGKSTAEMKTQSTFTGWDFSTIWSIKSGLTISYPYLTNGGAYVPGESYVTGIPQTIAFPDMPLKMWNDADFSPGASSSSGLTISYSSDNTGVATIISGMVHIVGTGTVNITASQPGNINYAAATDVTKSLTVQFPLQGAGTQGDPYLITTLSDLNFLSWATAIWSKYFRQTATIDASATATWNSNAGFSPIGTQTTKFTGVYNGNGKTITNLSINRPSLDFTGLFGRVSGASITNLGVVNATITGYDRTGGLAGNIEAKTTVENCFSTGLISAGANNAWVGGLVGFCGNSTIKNSYSTCSVEALTGDATAGGLEGYATSDTLVNCYSAGLVTGTCPTVKGFAGETFNSVTTNCFWDTLSSGKTTSAGGALGKNTTEMKTITTYTTTTPPWDFTSIWVITTGYPFLRIFRTTPTITTWPAASTISYGQALSASVLSGGAASVPGTFTFSTPTTIPDTGTGSQSVTFTPSDEQTYAPVSGSASLVVGKAKPSISTQPVAQAIDYGSTLSSSTITGSASVAGVFAFAFPDSIPTSGTRGHLTLFSPDDKRYDTLQLILNVTVNKKSIVVITMPAASAITYGDSIGASVISGGSAGIVATPVAGAYLFLTPSVKPNAGTARCPVLFQPVDTNYISLVVTSDSVNVVVALKALTIKADDKSKVYGTNDPVFTATGTGFVNGETMTALAGTLTFTKTPDGNSAGTYTITPTGPTSANYAITFVPGTFTITGSVAQSITFGPLSIKTFGDAPFVVSATATSGLPVTFTSSDTTIATIVSPDSIKIVGPGKVAIIASQAGNCNYAAAANVAETLSVVPKAPLLIVFGGTVVPATPLLIWTKMIGAITYHIQVASVSSFATTTIDSNNVVDTLFAQADLANDTKFFWRVRAHGSAGTSLWSAVDSFTTIVALPGKVTINKLLPSDTIHVDSAIISWHAVVPSIDRYCVQVSVDTTKDTLFFADTSITDTLVTVRHFFDRTYFVRGRAHNAAGWGSFGAWHSITILRPTAVFTQSHMPGSFAFDNKAGLVVYDLPVQVQVSLKIYNIKGVRVATVVNSMQPAGRYTLRDAMNGLGSGQYIFDFRAGTYSVRRCYATIR